MKLLFSMLCFLCVTSMHAQEFSARVAVHDGADVIALHKMGYRIDDAKVRERVAENGAVSYQAVWNAENGFVTVIVSELQLDRLRNSGHVISTVRELGSGAVGAVGSPLDTIPYQFGWPRTIFNGNSLYENSPTVADINLNGELNVSVTNAWGSYQPVNPPYVITWRPNGAYLSGYPVALEPGQFQSSADAGISAAADIYGDAKLEIVCGDENGFLYAFGFDGTALPGFPVNFGASHGVYTPALADMDNDGKAEIAVVSDDWSTSTDAFLHLFKVTASGPVEMTGFPISLGKSGENSPAIGDIDHDGEFEIVVGTGGSSDGTYEAQIIAFRKNGTVMDGFPWIVGRNTIGNSPTLYDLNNDGMLEIIIRVMPDYNLVNGIYAIDHTGNLLPGFPFPITYGNAGACVAVGDMTGDGIPELAYGGVEAVDSGKVWAFGLSGNLLSGFPARVYRTWVDGSVAIADVDGDGLGDVVCGTNGVTSKPGLMHAFNYLGQEISGFPLSPGNPLLNSFETHVTLVDIDRDGDTEIFAGRLDKYVYGWDTPGLYDSVNVWSTFKGNAARTGGQLRSPIMVSAEEHASIPHAFRLEQNFPNPFNPATTIAFEVPDGVDFISLSVYDVLGRKIATLAEGRKQPGRYAVTWDAEYVASGTYFYRFEAGSSIETKRMMLLR